MNKGKNKEILEKAPNMDYLDCSLIIKLIERDNNGNIIFEKLMTRDFLNSLHISAKSLLSKAIENTKKYRFDAFPINYMLIDNLKLSEFKKSIIFYSFGHNIKENGAAPLFLIEKIKEFELRKNCRKIIIIPVSIEELIIVPISYKDYSNSKVLRQIKKIREISLLNEENEKFLTNKMFLIDINNNKLNLINICSINNYYKIIY